MTSEGTAGSQDLHALPLRPLIESLLFASGEPVSIERLAAVLESSLEQVKEAIDELAAECEQRGIRIQRKGERVQMVTAPEAAEPVRRLLGLEQTARLSPAALETLAIVAYRQPVTRTQIEAVRGVSSDSVLRTLLNYGLIEEQARLDQAGRPIVYGTTFEFLQRFGLSTLERLPPLREWSGSSEVEPAEPGSEQ